MSKFSRRDKVLLELFVGSCALLAIIATSFFSINNLRWSNSWVRHTYQVIAHIDRLSIEMLSAESNQRGFLITNKNTYLSSFYAAVEQAGEVESNLTYLVHDNPSQAESLKRLNLLADKRIAVLQEVAELKRNGKDNDVYKIILSDKGRRLMNEYIQLSQQFKDKELELLAIRTQDEELAENTLNSIVIFGSVITLVLVFGYSLIVVNLKSSKVS